MKKLHPGVKWHFRLIIYFISFSVLLVLFIVLGILLAQIIFNSTVYFLVFFIMFIFLVIIVAETITNLTYYYWRYDFDETGLRTERGIIWKKYSTIPYERIQNVDIRRGILARLFGYSELSIHTAGYAVGFRSEGYIPAVGVEEAETIRKMIMEKISKHKGN